MTNEAALVGKDYMQEVQESLDQKQSTKDPLRHSTSPGLWSTQDIIN